MEGTLTILSGLSNKFFALKVRNPSVTAAFGWSSG
jgi:hypothetical protein